MSNTNNFLDKFLIKQLSNPNKALAYMTLSSYNTIRFGKRDAKEKKSFNEIMLSLIDILNCPLPARKQSTKKQRPRVKSRAVASSSRAAAYVSSHLAWSNINQAVSSNEAIEHTAVFKLILETLEHAYQLPYATTDGAKDSGDKMLINYRNDVPSLIKVPFKYKDKTIFNRADKILQTFIANIPHNSHTEASYKVLYENPDKILYVPYELRKVLNFIVNIWRPNQMFPDLASSIDFWLKDLVKHPILADSFMFELISMKRNMVLSMVQQDEGFESGYTFLLEYLKIRIISKMPSHRIVIKNFFKDLMQKAELCLNKCKHLEQYFNIKEIVKKRDEKKNMIREHNKRVLKKINPIKWPEGEVSDLSTTDVSKFFAYNFPNCSKNIMDFIANNVSLWSSQSLRRAQQRCHNKFNFNLIILFYSTNIKKIDGKSIVGVAYQNFLKGEDLELFKNIVLHFRLRIMFLNGKKFSKNKIKTLSWNGQKTRGIKRPREN